MKLLYCEECHDLFALNFKRRFCQCRKSWGYYKKDGLNAVIKGGTPIGIANDSFRKSLMMAKIENKYQHEPTTCLGVDFKAFVILECATTIKREE